MLSGGVERFYSGKAPGEVIVREGCAIRALDPRPDLSEQSRAVFSWGSDEIGASQLAIALLADALNDDRAATRYQQDFKNRMIANLPERWTVSRSRILGYVRLIKRQKVYAVALDPDGRPYISALMPSVPYKSSP